MKQTAHTLLLIIKTVAACVATFIMYEIIAELLSTFIGDYFSQLDGSGPFQNYYSPNTFAYQCSAGFIAVVYIMAAIMFYLNWRSVNKVKKY